MENYTLKTTNLIKNNINQILYFNQLFMLSYLTDIFNVTLKHLIIESEIQKIILFLTIQK